MFLFYLPFIFLNVLKVLIYWIDVLHIYNIENFLYFLVLPTNTTTTKKPLQYSDLLHNTKVFFLLQRFNKCSFGRTSITESYFFCAGGAYIVLFIWLVMHKLNVKRNSLNLPRDFKYVRGGKKDTHLFIG